MKKNTRTTPTGLKYISNQFGFKDSQSIPEYSKKTRTVPIGLAQINASKKDPK